MFHENEGFALRWDTTSLPISPENLRFLVFSFECSVISKPP